jgi:5-hydroxyisourate hydrolase-like protein (transthyretin family)
MTMQKVFSFLLFVLLFSINIHAQETIVPFEKEWKEIDSLIQKKNLPKSALNKLSLLKDLTIKANLADQTIKCLLYQLSLEETLAEYNPNITINGINNLLKKTTNPIQQAILHSIVAKNYLRYFQENRYTIITKKRLPITDSTDIQNFTDKQIHTSIQYHFEQSLINKELLLKTPISQYNALIIEGNEKTFSLFDLLVDEAIQYYSGDDFGPPGFNPSFEWSEPNYLASAKIFLDKKITDKQTVNKNWRALQLYQTVLAAHIADKDPFIFVRFDLDRISWVNKKSKALNKNALYVKSLQEIIDAYSSCPNSIKAYYMLADDAVTKAYSYDPFGDTSKRNHFVIALNYINEAKKKYSEVVYNSSYISSLLGEINKIVLSATVEKINQPDKPFRLFLNYRNTDSVYGRIIKLDSLQLRETFQNEDKKWQAMLNMPVIQSFKYNLPAASDLQEHAVELKINSLPNGHYQLITCNNSEFKLGKSYLSNSQFTVSNLTYIRDGETDNYYVRDWETGKPVANAKVKVLTDGAYKMEEVISTTTDENGQFIAKTESRHVYFEIKKDKDYLFSIEYEWPNYHDEDDSKDAKTDEQKLEQANKQLIFYTDRSIYRPGQIVQFKGISITKGKAKNSSKIYTQAEPVRIFIRDPNQMIVDSIKLKLNEYGSLSGTFTLPLNGLTGTYKLVAAYFKNSSKEIKVEEYKRPKFTISFQEDKHVYRYNDSVFVKGSVIAMAGYPLKNATVKYVISQNIQLKAEPIQKRRMYIEKNSEPSEMATGEIKSNDNGDFEIAFKTLLRSDLSEKPISNYTIEASVTDLNGETHTQNNTIIASNIPLQPSIKAPVAMNRNKINTISVKVLNIKEENIASTVKIALYKTEQPNFIHRKRLWQRPDQYLLTENEYHRIFPYDEYNNESDKNSWPLKRIDLIDSIILTKDKPSITLKENTIESGVYKIIATTTDSFGTISTDEQFVQVYDPKESQMGIKEMYFTDQPVIAVKTNDTAQFITGSSLPNYYLIRKINSLNPALNKLFFLQKEGIESLTIVPTDKERGNIFVTDAFILKGQFYTHQYKIEVPFLNKQLKLNYASFRKINEPGSKATLTVTVNCLDSSINKAELLTGMYDASLDELEQFFTWKIPEIWNSLDKIQLFNAKNDGITRDCDYSRSSFSDGKGTARIEYIKNKLGSKGWDFWKKNDQYFDYSGIRRTQVKYNYDKISSAYELENSQAAMVEQLVDKRRVLIGNLNNTSTNNTRKNFNETAFFFPQLLPDSAGKYQFSFSFPESLTKWKWISLAHTKDLAFGLNSEEIITQKTLMVQPNAPRFMREGDNMEFSSKIVNLSNKELTGTVSLALIDATTNRSVDGWFQNVFPNQYFTAEAGQSIVVKFPIQIPFSFNKALTWRIIAKAGDYSDGEENTLPVITNRQLVTESLPIFLEKDTTVQLNFTKLLNANSATSTNQLLSVEYTSNPLWNVVKALPYLMESSNESTDQLFHRFYANQLAAFIVQKNPIIQSVFEAWRKDSSSLRTNLEKNTALKQILLSETPWVLQSANESDQQKRIAQLFDAAKLSTESNDLIEKLSQLQYEDGSFPWFKGGNPDEFITNIILTGLGKLKKIGAIDPRTANQVSTIIENALDFSDKNIEKDYQSLLKQKIDLSKPVPNYRQLNYLFMRSFYGDIPMKFPKAQQYFYQQSKINWNKLNTYSQGMLALISSRNNKRAWAVKNILPSLLENTIINSKQGMYWKNQMTQYWYSSPIEFQSMMINCFSEINQEEKNNLFSSSINSMRTWLILNKQTNHWNTSAATAEACYALLLNGSSGMKTLSNKKQVQIKMGKLTFNSLNEQKEAGTGYFQKTIEGEKIIPEMGNIQLSVTEPNKIGNQNQPSYGAVYWQYIEDLDKIAKADGPLLLTKQIFVERIVENKKSLVQINDNDEIQLGEKLVVQLKIQSDRDMDYIHVKDLRAAAMEPLNVMSGNKWEGRLAYYVSTKDVSSNFYISNLPKGNYTLSYEMNATQIGIFSVGIASIQSIYAPAFNSHSNGIKIRVKE